MRNVKEQAEKGNEILNNSRAKITAGELQQIYEVYQGQGLFEALVTTFYFGVEVGAKVKKNGSVGRHSR